jgi:pantoate--beta-alanine ligase
MIQSSATAGLQFTASARETFELVFAQKRAGKTVGLVPTMGALHAGHLSLVERSRRECDFTVVSIFVNPKQFAPHEDFSNYPRNLDDDLGKLSTLDVDLVFAPPAEEIYPPGFSTYVDVGALTEPWEGRFRPGHFRGVATVVLKLFQIAPADRAYFGRKDYQQVRVVEKLVADLNLAVEIVVCPIVRAADGLALSSRNIYLSDGERRSALVLSRSLKAAREMFAAGERDAKTIRDHLQHAISAATGVKLEYAAIVDPATLAELPRIESSAVALVAAQVGNTRLIDNEVLGTLKFDDER